MVILFHHPLYFSRDTIEADSWSWVANYVRLSAFQAQLWSNRMKKQDQTARLKMILPFGSLRFAASLPVSVSVTASLCSIPPASFYIYAPLGAFPVSSLGRQRKRGIYKSLVLRKLHPAQPYSWESVWAWVWVCVCVFQHRVPAGRAGGSPQKKNVFLSSCQQIFCCYSKP